MEGQGHGRPMVAEGRRSFLLWGQRIFAAIGLATLAWYAFASADAFVFQAFESRRLEQMQGEGGSSLPRGTLLGRLEIPRLGVSAIVAEGVDRRTLRRAVGHVPGTALPGEIGNVALAGHRDTFFRSLHDIRRSDVVTLATPAKTYRYRVESIRVVGPRETQLLRDSRGPSLTLVTCYPFSYVGPAPDRFVVIARRLDARAGTASGAAGN